MFFFLDLISNSPRPPCGTNIQGTAGSPIPGGGDGGPSPSPLFAIRKIRPANERHGAAAQGRKLTEPIHQQRVGKSNFEGCLFASSMIISWWPHVQCWKPYVCWRTKSHTSGKPKKGKNCSFFNWYQKILRITRRPSAWHHQDSPSWVRMESILMTPRSSDLRAFFGMLFNGEHLGHQIMDA